MGRKKQTVVEEPKKRSYDIISASISDDFCNYSFEITEGLGLGDKHDVSGSGIVKDDMKEAFAKFNVHMACIDDVFKHSGIEVSDIDQMHDHQLTYLYNATGFKIKGSGDSEAIILIGNKYISAGGRIKMETPRISIDNMSSYKWYNELKAVADQAREEVALYKEGKYTKEVEDEERELRKQTKIKFMPPADEEVVDPDFEPEQTMDADFQNAAL